MVEPTLAGVPDEQLRPALDAAFVVAVEGRKERPSVAPPDTLRPYLKFQKLPRTALAVVRKALDDDADFRQRVAAATSPETVGPGGHAWLARQEGWQAVVREAFAGGDGPETIDQAAARRESKRRAAAESAAARTAAEMGELRLALERERSARCAAEAAATDLRRQVEALRGEVDGLKRRARRSEESASATTSDLDAAQRRISDLQRMLHETAAVRDLALAERAELEDAADAPSPPLAARPAAQPAAGAAVRDAAASLRTAAAALEAAAAAITAPAPAPSRPAPTPMAARHPRAGSTAHRLRRRPLSMPGGVSASSVDGALHLLRSPDLELVVDGYNVAMLAWPALELADRRERCIDAVEDIIRRYGTRALVVFDGADVAVAVKARRLARVRFSPPGVIADDVIREVVASLPSEQPVAVATNDREVVASVRAMGANTITSEILLAAAGRLR